MKKKVLTIITGGMLAASVGFAAPITDLQPNETTIGYNHYNLSADGLDINDDSFYAEHAVSDKVILGVEKNTYSAPGPDFDTTDIYAHYHLNPQLRLIVGHRNYSDGPDKMFYGVGASTALAPRLDGYASVTASSMATDWQVGAAYKLNSQASLQLGYKSYKEDGLPRADGLGFGVNYSF